MIQRTSLNFLLSFLMVLGLSVFGFVLALKPIIQNVRTASAAMSKNELTLALELYYADHDRYPISSGGSALLAELSAGGYIRRGPKDISRIQYNPLDNAQLYFLDLK